jgi:hypothetical protein
MVYMSRHDHSGVGDRRQREGREVHLARNSLIAGRSCKAKVRQSGERFALGYILVSSVDPHVVSVDKLS